MNTFSASTFSAAATRYDARGVYTCSCTLGAACAGCTEHNALYNALSAAERAAVDAQVEAGASDALACVAV
jgi:hypothetical protein